MVARGIKSAAAQQKGLWISIRRVRLRIGIRRVGLRIGRVGLRIGRVRLRIGIRRVRLRIRRVRRWIGGRRSGRRHSDCKSLRTKRV